jgi:glycosyltransferase involved in cell wall biosynthesis
MRIVHIITRLIIGGAQENTLLTVDRLHHYHGDDVTLIAGPADGPEGDLFDHARQRGLKVTLMPELVRPVRLASDLGAYWRLRRAFRQLQPEVVHTHSAKAGIIGRAAAWHERVPVVVHTVHGPSFGPFETRMRNCLYLVAERWAARRCHAMVSVCNAMTDQYLNAGVGRPEQYQTVYSGMDVEAFLHPPRSREEVRHELGLTGTEVAFGTVARLFENKGHDDILTVAPRVLAANPDVRFVFIGDGIYRQRLIAEAKRLGLEHAFHFVGLVPPSRIPELLAALDVIVHPSLREGLARVLPQALLVGRPVISYDIDGAREVVLPETGILLGVRDLGALSAAILRLAADPILRQSFGQEGRRRFAHQFRYETMTNQLRTLYERLLSNTHAAHGALADIHS